MVLMTATEKNIRTGSVCLQRAGVQSVNMRVRWRELKMVNIQVTGFGVCVKRNRHKNSYDDDEGTEKLALLTEPLRGSLCRRLP